jgi:isoamylase
MLSRGAAMISMGDEVGRTQNGNNNAYCQNNEISWFNWNDLKTNKDILQFAKKMIKFRADNQALSYKEFYTGQVNGNGVKDIEWHGVKLFSPEWENGTLKILAFTIGGMGENSRNIHVMMNFNYFPLHFEIPSLADGKRWTRFIDTSLDDSKLKKEVIIDKSEYFVSPYSIVILT